MIQKSTGNREIHGNGLSGNTCTLSTGELWGCLDNDPCTAKSRVIVNDLKLISPMGEYRSSCAKKKYHWRANRESGVTRR